MVDLSVYTNHRMGDMYHNIALLPSPNVDKSTPVRGKVQTTVSYGKPGARQSKGKRKQIRD